MKTIERIALIVLLPGIATSGFAATQLTVARSGNEIVLSCPLATSNEFYLQFTTNLYASSWSNSADPTTNGATLVVTNQATDQARFYRLQAWEPLFDGVSTAVFRGYRQADLPGTNQWMVTTNGEL